MSPHLWQSNRGHRDMTETELAWLARHGFFAVAPPPGGELDIVLRDAATRIERARFLLAYNSAPAPEPEVVTAPAGTNVFGTRLRRWRRGEADLTLRQVSDRTGLSVAYLSDLERGRLSNPSMKTIQAIAKVTGIPAVELLG